MRLIETDADLAEGAAHLSSVCPVWAGVLPELTLPLRRRSDGFAAILDAVIGQQISVAAAGAIMARLKEAGLTDAAAIRAAGPDALRECGVSRPKIRYLTGIVENEPDWLALRSASDDEVAATLVALPGIGQWTAEIYLAFALGRSDAFPAGDLALQESARLLYGLETRPGPKQLLKMAEPWQPWRAIAARGLWAYYRVAKGREGVRS
ncbi:DNA-3-methyladenine glycosylase family protein [Paracoccus aerodenitrificans]|uniref:DNA-3-methyladenine glycosylase family protein n=1 Tax=Paracoccus aerodenitrificans TaxID=3017781 RepID=UPI0022F00E15|nr:DNA-3-methyladenine glycosylase 2 family protein [Paracoccus aerodenitrificans]WBU64611.1 DNA-3-methyladenine glycosylase 2 family protein [Paracoccus aerodenitrificans]